MVIVFIHFSPIKMQNHLIPSFATTKEQETWQLFVKAIGNCICETKDIDGSIIEIGCAEGMTTVFLKKYMM